MEDDPERGPRAATAARMAALVPAAEVATIAGAGHEVHLECPREWRAALERFLDRAGI